MKIENIEKIADPEVVAIVERALSNKDLYLDEVERLLKCRGIDLYLICLAADYLRKETVGDIVTYVVNRNINFTNVCIMNCGFCAFSRDFRSEETYFLPIEEVVRRAKEAYHLGATEVCIQGGLPPKLDWEFYPKLIREIKKEVPNIHIHAFSPVEIWYGTHLSKLGYDEFLKILKEAGLDTIPGTAAEILDDEIRKLISPGRISTNEWVTIIKTAHKLGIPSTSTIMYGHVENEIHRAKHLLILREIQKETKGFTEFVPLSFVYEEAPMYKYKLVNNIKAGPTGEEIIALYATSRLVLNNYIKNLQVSWVKEGPKFAQFLLSCGANDFGGTLINESISSTAGAKFGQYMSPKEIRRLIFDAKRIPAQRTTTYSIIRVFKDINEEGDIPLEKIEWSEEKFGSYFRLIKDERFRFRKRV
ncbi:MAG: 5-amino-6-(D-ribitylamino)uracil--L-tyrosine 4-hydroxyphenyl transferase CofH [Thermoproteota archaeon]|nr:5-amino-6-(D-ribitylamino)uracil--L-tyrosine 4-hydroxyphenyl transferase CofH [Thermoproteota archaeon]